MKARSRLGVGLILLAVTAGVFGPLAVVQDPLIQDLSAALQPPSAEHPLGTDPLGRSVLSRLVHGARQSLGTALACVAASGLLGSSLGMAAGFSRGWRDGLIMRLVDGFMAFPGILLAIVIAGLLGGGRLPLIGALALTGWCDYCRLSRNVTRSVLSEPYVQAGHLLGFRPLFIIRRYVLGQILPHVATLASLGMGRTILNISALGFLGIGLRPPAPEWGAMISQALPYMSEAPHLIIFPGAAIFLTVLGFNLLTSLFEGRKT
ncbi:MAG TPA: ABC transporter permease [Chromatiaceae bacterium]|nr:ABC transporter permease [Chromatiaceae bacterium]